VTKLANRRSALAPLLASAALCGACAACVSVAAAAPEDLNGVWLVQDAPKAVLTSDGERPPLLPEAAKLYEGRVAARARGDSSFDRTTWCASAGAPRLMLEPLPFEILVQPRVVAFMYEWNRWVRLVDLTGAELPVYYPTSFGTASGRFEGDTLVVESRGLMKETFIDASGLPHGDDMILTERLTLTAPDVLENRIRVDDPATYASAWETRVVYRRQSGARIREDVCLDDIKQGKPGL
jgi:hypothetical protein